MREGTAVFKGALKAVQVVATQLRLELGVVDAVLDCAATHLRKVEGVGCKVHVAG